jgi:hypothetical protein
MDEWISIIFSLALVAASLSWWWFKQCYQQNFASRSEEPPSALEPVVEQVVGNEIRCVPPDQSARTYPAEYVSDTASGIDIRVYFMCGGCGTAYTCMTVLQPKCYMCHCGTTYRTKYGVIVEIVTRGVDGILYCRAPVPDEHVNDMRAMLHEPNLKPTTPEALYQAVPVCKLSLKSLIVERKTDWHGNLCDNQWTFISKKDYQDLPQLDWCQVFNLFGSCQEAEKGAVLPTVDDRASGGYHV